MTPLLLLWLGCANKVEDSAACSARDPALTWRNFGDAFFTSHCTGCHHAMNPEGSRGGAPLGVDFDTYAGALAQIDRIEARTVPEDGGMPPEGPLTEEQRGLLAEWIGCGAPP